MTTETTEEAAATTASVRIERVLPHPPRRVWRALTRPEALDRWLLPIAPEESQSRALDTPGDRVRMRPAPTTRVSYEVTESEPERRLALRWTVETPHQEPEPTSVTWTLTPEQDGAATRLVIEHRPMAMAMAARAAHLSGAMARLSVYLELGAIRIARRRQTARARYASPDSFYRQHSQTIRREERTRQCR